MCRRSQKFRLSLQFIIGSLLFCYFLKAAFAETNEIQRASTSIGTNFDARREFALGMIESGNDDRGIGPAGEISRFQIHPAVWKVYTASREYQTLEVSLPVARQHWSSLRNYFREKTAREPSDFDMYVLWNTRYGYYARKSFDSSRLPAILRDRAQRFVNLVNRKA